MQDTTKPLPLGWQDPRTKNTTCAGVAFFNQQYGDYLLKIDEEPKEKQYFLRPFAAEDDKVVYRVELVIKKADGKFLKRQKVGEGYSGLDNDKNVYINYGSKYKTLVLLLDNQ